MATFYEFFAGGGMVRAGLGPSWTCLFANDVDPKKGASYRANWGGDALRLGDVAALEAGDLPGHADLAWGSFPCQDLSLAGAGAGLSGARSGLYHEFWRLIGALDAEGRAPRIVAVENVVGALTARDGADFAVMLRAFAEHGYRPGAMVIDAADFTPQSRPRLFVVGVRGDWPSAGPGWAHPASLVRAVERLPAALRDAHLWFDPPAPPARNAALIDILEDAPPHPADRTERLLSLMAPLHLARVKAAQDAGGRHAGCVFRRTRRDPDGTRRQRAEVRFDGLAGCLRTPAGGSSRQTLLIVEDGEVTSRLLSPRETARLMGLADDYVLPKSATDAYHLTGDGVAVPVARWLARHLFEPMLSGAAAA